QLQGALWGTLQRQFQEVGIEQLDEPGHLKEPLDSTLLALGVAYVDLDTGEVATGKEYAATVIAKRFGYEAIRDAALNRVDVSVDAPNVSLKDSQFVAHIERALERAKADAEPYMETGVSSWGVGSFSLDYL